MTVSADQGWLESVVHRIIKSPGALAVKAEEVTTVYRGTARSAVLQYPQDANVPPTRLNGSQDL